ncbi:MAG: F0F1 ATP synthase subunit delta [Epsilonproteobacteria bacterium]|nr:F0F1 ATP synthase subunit delta [Campylobacterota bacterium]
MNMNIAKRYVKALMEGVNKKELEKIYDSLSKLVLAFEDRKFIDIILSPDVSAEKKEEFVLSLLDTKDKYLQNFIKLLVSHKRLLDIPAIVKELDYQLSFMKNEHRGFVISNFKIDKSQLNKLEEGLSKKFDSKIKLQNKVTDYPGIKVEIDTLGVEVGLSQDRIKAQLMEHILKAI